MCLKGRTFASAPTARTIGPYFFRRAPTHDDREEIVHCEPDTVVHRSRRWALFIPNVHPGTGNLLRGQQA